MKQFKRVMFHDTEEFPKFEEKLTLGSKNDMRNLVNFNVSSGNSESLHFDVVPFSIAYKVSVKKSTEELSLMTPKKNPNFEEKLTFCSKNVIRKSEQWKVWKTFTLMGYFCKMYVTFGLTKYRGTVL